MEIRTYLGIIGRYWWVVLLTTLSAVAGAALLSGTRTPTYSAHARVVVRPAPTVTDSRTVVDLVGQMGARYIVNTFAQMFTSAQVKSDSLRAINATEASVQDYDLAANVLPDTAVIEVSGSGPDPDFLANYINATVTATIDDSRDLFQVVELVSVEPASAPQQPTSPQPLRDIPLAGLFGLVVGILLALLIDYLRRPAPQSVATLSERDSVRTAGIPQPAEPVQIMPYAVEQTTPPDEDGGWLPARKQKGGTFAGRGGG
jgi:uncharacterized protein involved in exopolysaccharide biosynthesis